MPIALNQIVDRGISTAVQRRLGLGGDATLSLMPELAVTMDLGPQSEILYNLGWRRYAHSLTLAQVAAQRNHYRFRVVPNPAGSPGVVVVLESICIDAATSAGQFVLVDLLGTATTDQANPFPNHAALDYRMVNVGGSLTQGSSVIVSDENSGTAATLGVFYSGAIPGQGNPFFIPGIAGVCLTGGMGVQVDLNNINVGSNIQFVWRERMLNDQERAI